MPMFVYLRAHFLLQTLDSETNGIVSVVPLPPKSPAFDLLSKMLEYVPFYDFGYVS